MAAIIEVKDLCHTYSAGTPFEHVAVDHISFTVEKGEYSRGNKYSGKVAVFSERFQEKASEYQFLA